MNMRNVYLLRMNKSVKMIIWTSIKNVTPFPISTVARSLYSLAITVLPAEIIVPDIDIVNLSNGSKKY